MYISGTSNMKGTYIALGTIVIAVLIGIIVILMMWRRYVDIVVV